MLRAKLESVFILSILYDDCVTIKNNRQREREGRQQSERLKFYL